MAPFYKISVHEKTKENFFSKFPLIKKSHLNDMWCGGTTIRSLVSRLKSNYQNPIFFKWGRCKDSPDLQFLALYVERLLLQTNKKASCVWDLVRAILYHLKGLWYVPLPPTLILNDVMKFKTLVWGITVDFWLLL